MLSLPPLHAHLVFSLQNYTEKKNAFLINETNGKIAGSILAAQQIYLFPISELTDKLCLPYPACGEAI